MKLTDVIGGTIDATGTLVLTKNNTAFTINNSFEVTLVHFTVYSVLGWNSKFRSTWAALKFIWSDTE